MSLTGCPLAQVTLPSKTDRSRLASLKAAIGQATRVLILPHNDPDPDAIASAVALDHVIRSLVPAETAIAYGGVVGRAENRALVRYLGVHLEKIGKIEFAEFERVALVDSQPGAGNNALPPHRVADIVIDHHEPLRDRSRQARHIDIRFDAGATSTILTGYLMAAGVEIHPRLATALFYGIQTDTMGLGRRISAADQQAYVHLQPLIEADELIAIQRAQVPREYFRVFAQALRGADVYGGAVAAHLGETYRPDMPAEMADVLLRLEGTRWVICSGFHRDTLFLSFRSLRASPSAGQLAQAVVGELGLAGGHGSAGGGQVPLKGWDREALVQEVQRRFLAELHLEDVEADRLISEEELQPGD